MLLLSLVSACSSSSTSENANRADYVFADHVPGSHETFERADLPGARTDGILSARVTLRGETRLSLIPPDPSRLQFAVDVPSRSPVLRFAIATGTLTEPKFRSPVAFKMTITSGTDEEILFQESMPRRERNRWHDREIDLANWAGADAQIVLETVLPEGEEDLFPLWGHPVLSANDPEREQPKLILISMDCLRADHVGVYGYERDTTPSIDRLAEDAVLFETHIAASSTTLPTHMSMFTGLTPSEHGANNRHQLNRSVAYLPELLSQSGMQVDGVVSGAYLAQNFGFERGFHTYLSLRRPRASETVDAALRVLDRTGGQAQFFFLHFIDAHWPYDPPETMRERFGPIRTDVPRLQNKVLKQIPPDGPEEIRQAIDLYDAEIAYADGELGRFLDELKARDLYDSSFIVLTADHGEAFHEHGTWQHGWTLYEEIVHVPLLIKFPESSKTGRVSSLTSQVDIFATILNRIGVELPHARSRDLVHDVDAERPSDPRRVSISEFISNPAPGERPSKHVSQRTRERKYIATFRTGGDELSIEEMIRDELYDLTTDPGENENLLLDETERLEERRRELAAYLEEAKLYRSWTEGEMVIEDDAIRERLRALGYLQ